MADVFEEVEEQLRSARAMSLVKKGWPWALGAAVLALAVTAAIWGWREYQSAQADTASQTYQRGLEALVKNDDGAAETAFAEVAKDGPKGYRALALMQQAGLRSTVGKSAEAVALLDEAAKVASEPFVADAAALKAAYLVFDTAPLADLEKRLTPLTAAGRPYVALAREALAMKRLASGRTAEARSALALLAISPDASESLQSRAQIAMAQIDAGQAPNLSVIARTAAALPADLVRDAKIAAAQAAAAQQAAQQAAQNAPQNAPPGAAVAPPQSGAPQ